MKDASVRTTGGNAPLTGNLSCESLGSSEFLKEIHRDEVIVGKVKTNSFYTFPAAIGNKVRYDRLLKSGLHINDLSIGLHNYLFTNNASNEEFCNECKKVDITQPLAFKLTPSMFKGIFKGKHIRIRDIFGKRNHERVQNVFGDVACRVGVKEWKPYMDFIISSVTISQNNFVDHTMIKINLKLNLTNLSLEDDNKVKSDEIRYFDGFSLPETWINNPLSVSTMLKGDDDGDFKILSTKNSSIEDLIDVRLVNKDNIAGVFATKESHFYRDLIKYVNSGIIVSTSITLEDYLEALMTNRIGELVVKIVDTATDKFAENSQIVDICYIYRQLIQSMLTYGHKSPKVTEKEIQGDDCVSETFVLNSKNANVYTLTATKSKTLNNGVIFTKRVLDTISLLTNVNEDYILNASEVIRGNKIPVTINLPLNEVKKQLRGYSAMDQAYVNCDKVSVEQWLISKIVATTEEETLKDVSKNNSEIKRTETRKSEKYKDSKIDVYSVSVGYIVCNKDLAVSEAGVRDLLFRKTFLPVYVDTFDNLEDSDIFKIIEGMHVETDDGTISPVGFAVDFTLKPTGLVAKSPLPYSVTDDLVIMELIVDIVFKDDRVMSQFLEKIDQGLKCITLSSHLGKKSTLIYHDLRAIHSLSLTNINVVPEEG